MLIGQDNLFPYVIEYRTNAMPDGFSPQEMSYYQLQPNPLLVLWLYNVRFDLEVPDRRFAYPMEDTEPLDNVEPEDLTAAYLERLRESNRKRIAAWKQRLGLNPRSGTR